VPGRSRREGVIELSLWPHWSASSSRSLPHYISPQTKNVSSEDSERLRPRRPPQATQQRSLHQEIERLRGFVEGAERTVVLGREKKSRRSEPHVRIPGLPVISDHRMVGCGIEAMLEREKFKLGAKRSERFEEGRAEALRPRRASSRGAGGRRTGRAGEAVRDRLKATLKAPCDTTSGAADGFDLVGHSMGALVSMQAAVLAPDRVLRVVAIDTVGPMDLLALPSVATATLRLLPFVYPSAGAYCAGMRATGILEPWEDLWKRAFAYELKGFLGGVRPRTSFRAVAEDLVYNLFHTGTSLWPRLRLPTLLVRATRRLPPFGFVVGGRLRDAFLRTAPSAELAEVDANHFEIMAHPDALRAVDEFLGRTAVGRATSSRVPVSKSVPEGLWSGVDWGGSPILLDRGTGSGVRKGLASHASAWSGPQSFQHCLRDRQKRGWTATSSIGGRDGGEAVQGQGHPTADPAHASPSPPEQTFNGRKSAQRRRRHRGRRRRGRSVNADFGGPCCS